MNETNPKKDFYKGHEYWTWIAVIIVSTFIIIGVMGSLITSNTTLPQANQSASVYDVASTTTSQIETVTTQPVSNPTPSFTQYNPAPAAQSQPEIQTGQSNPLVSPPTQSDTQNLSNDNYYVNSVGNTVHSPAYSTNNSVPVGATARCRDGTYSFSQSRSGTCSHHGGVGQWLY